MNAMSATIPLPAILNQPAYPGPSRRHRIDNFDLSQTAVDQFNALLLRLGRREPLDCDRIVTAARELRDGTVHDAAPPCIQQRMQRLEAAARMIRDAAWDAVDEAGNAAALVVQYAHSQRHLIPRTVPTVSGLDDAIVVEAAWPTLADEVASFLDFCRIREVEAQLRGCDATKFGFNRADWEQARRAEAALETQRRCIRDGSYLPALAPRFYVH